MASTILVADDDASCREALVDVLERDGFQAHGVPCGMDAVELAREVRFDLSILDMHMPDLNGLETFLELRRIQVVLPGVIMTADGSGELHREVIRAGAVTLLLKPLDLGALRPLIWRILGHGPAGSGLPD
ncbi:MAG: response regulator [Planctomycetes bacterium]|nr:response regulator [Planctomycetota bacterium]